MSPTAPDPNLMLVLLFLAKTVSKVLRNDSVASPRGLGGCVCSNLKRRSSDFRRSSRGKTLKAVESTPSSRFLWIRSGYDFQIATAYLHLYPVWSGRRAPPVAPWWPLRNNPKRGNQSILRDKTQHYVLNLSHIFFCNWILALRHRYDPEYHVWSVVFPIKFICICKRNYPAEFKESYSVKGLIIKRPRRIRRHAMHSSIRSKYSNPRLTSMSTTKSRHVVAIERMTLNNFKYKSQFLDLYPTSESKQSILRPTRPSATSTFNILRTCHPSKKHYWHLRSCYIMLALIPCLSIQDSIQLLVTIIQQVLPVPTIS